jgi:hypothetical protein
MIKNKEKNISRKMVMILRRLTKFKLILPLEWQFITMPDGRKYR